MLVHLQMQATIFYGASATFCCDDFRVSVIPKDAASEVWKLPCPTQKVGRNGGTRAMLAGER
jgi:hypothetical protein